MPSHKREVSFSETPAEIHMNARLPKELSVDTNAHNLSVPGPSQPRQERSPGANLNITIMKRHYSVRRQDSLQQMATPVFDKNAQQRKTTPSSQGTVLTMAGLFVVGVTLMLSGLIVLCQNTETLFVIVGCLFMGIGFTMLFVCAILQRKNIAKFILDLNNDLYFLNMSDSYMWKVVFEDSNQETSA